MSEFLTFEIPILTLNGRQTAVLKCWDESPENPSEVKLRLEFDDRILEVRSEIGFFRALCDLRIRLEADGLLLVCYGASEGVYPSPLIEAMGCGEKAYRLSFGRQALSKDLVSIFDYGDDVIPSTVERQREVYEQWLSSL